MRVAIAIAGLSVRASGSTKRQNHRESLLLREPVPRHCTLDQEIPEVHLTRAAGAIRPTFLEDLGDTLFLWLLCC